MKNNFWKVENKYLAHWKETTWKGQSTFKPRESKYSSLSWLNTEHFSRQTFFFLFHTTITEAEKKISSSHTSRRSSPCVYCKLSHQPDLHLVNHVWQNMCEQIIAVLIRTISFISVNNWKQVSVSGQKRHVYGGQQRRTEKRSCLATSVSHKHIHRSNKINRQETQRHPSSFSQKWELLMFIKLLHLPLHFWFISLLL